MMRSMYSAVSGLRNHQTRMDVIGNNIANVNTAGFKKSRTTFVDKLYQSMRGGSRPSGTKGGTNPMAIGLGMGVGSVDQIHTAAPAASTGKITDLTVDGDGYFALKKSDGSSVFTRAGNFSWDDYGNLVNQDGLFVQGWLAKIEGAEYKITPSGDSTENLNIANFMNVTPRPTTEMRFTGNADSGMKINYGPGSTAAVPVAFNPATHVPAEDLESQIFFSQKVYDSLGNAQLVYYRMFKAQTDITTVGASPEWILDISLDPKFGVTTGAGAGTTPPPANAAALGKIGVAGTDDPADISLAIGDTYQRLRGITFTPGGAYNTVNNATFNIEIPVDTQYPNDPISFTVDMKGLTQYATNQTADDVVKRITTWQDGNLTGDLVSLDVGSGGYITGTYSNGETQNLGLIALATFQNPPGLVQTGGTLYKVSMNSGDAVIGAPGTGQFASLVPSSLEMSNVDLSEEFTDMIVTQRGFQANSRIITTSDEMLQELVNLKR